MAAILCLAWPLPAWKRLEPRSGCPESSQENEVTILARVLGNENGQLSRDFARYCLDHEISGRDKARMHDLAVRNQEDTLTPAEKEELNGFAKAATLLSILKSASPSEPGS